MNQKQSAVFLAALLEIVVNKTHIICKPVKIFRMFAICWKSNRKNLRVKVKEISSANLPQSQLKTRRNCGKVGHWVVTCQNSWYTAWLNNTNYFGLTGNHGNRQMKWGDVSLQCSANGSNPITWARKGCASAWKSFLTKLSWWANTPITLCLEQCAYNCCRLV